MMQVVTNLLSNAAKFSPPGSTVHIRARRQNARVRIEVEDHGMIDGDAAGTGSPAGTAEAPNFGPETAVSVLK